MIINNNSVEQINVALLDLEKKLSTIKDNKSVIDSLRDSINTIKASLNETKAGLTSGATYDINITGNATTATRATTADSAVSAESAERATTADSAVSAESAERASKDSNGNSITDTYATITTVDGKADKSYVDDNFATMDKVVKDSRTAAITLYNNPTGAFLESDMNLTATKSGILKISFGKKAVGYTLYIQINGIVKYEYPNWWGENIYETAYIPVNNGDNIRISSNVSGERDRYRIANVLII